MHIILALLITFGAFAVGWYGFMFTNPLLTSDDTSIQTQTNSMTSPQIIPPTKHVHGSLEIFPIEHASMVLQWGDTTIYVDPVGTIAQYVGKPAANIVLVTDIHGDHFSNDLLYQLVGRATLIAPKAVEALLDKKVAAMPLVLDNGMATSVRTIGIAAVPMYNLPETAESKHPKGRGNGYLLEHKDQRLYIAGDTAGIPEMRALKNIDIAFVPMNLPYTMSVEEAADAVLAFAPKVVYPYHYRGPNGLSDVAKFKKLVEAKNKNIQVVLADWYPNK